jgi:maltose/moltooligosaccharide transporter
VGSVVWSVTTTPEIPPDEQELAELRSKKRGFFEPFREIVSAISDMPLVLWKLGLVYLFQWYAMFCYWQFVSLSIAKSVFNGGPEMDRGIYEKAVVWAGRVNGFYNIVTFVSAFGLAWLVRKLSAKFVHVVCLLLASVGLIWFPHIHDPNMLYLPMVGFGIAWASMMGVPYIMVVGAIPKERYGVYMGIINMMIVIPMILQTLSFGAVYSHWLGSDPGKAIGFAGVLLGCAAFATLLIPREKTTEAI